MVRKGTAGPGGPLSVHVASLHGNSSVFVLASGTRVLLVLWAHVAVCRVWRAFKSSASFPSSVIVVMVMKHGPSFAAKRKGLPDQHLQLYLRKDFHKATPEICAYSPSFSCDGLCLRQWPFVHIHTQEIMVSFSLTSYLTSRPLSSPSDHNLVHRLLAFMLPPKHSSKVLRECGPQDGCEIQPLMRLWVLGALSSTIIWEGSVEGKQLGLQILQVPQVPSAPGCGRCRMG